MQEQGDGSGAVQGDSVLSDGDEVPDRESQLDAGRGEEDN